MEESLVYGLLLLVRLHGMHWVLLHQFRLRENVFGSGKNFKFIAFS